jgi:predicted amidohydrolase
MKIVLTSLDQKWEDKNTNLQRCEVLTEKAKLLGAELIIFPEMTLTGFSMNTSYSAEPANKSPSVNAFSRLAKDNQIAIFAGVVLNSGAKPSNALLAFSDDGKEQARYFKIHPFSFAKENEHFHSGNHLAKMTMSEFKFGFSICYDLRFPEIYSAMAKDCDVLVNIANWPRFRVDHWRTLLKARAIENQVFVIGVNRVGIDGYGLEYEPSSLVVNANGDFIQPIHSEKELDIYEISQQDLIDFRKSFSTRHDRRTEIYRELI